MDIATTIFVVVIIIFSAIIHEVMHGYMADMLGDPTARYAGRLTLNPIPHIDLFGSILLPFLLAFSGSPIFFGYAKPVPYNPYNLRPGKFSEALVGGAGPFANLAIALIAGLVIRLNLFPAASETIFLIVVVNCMLFLFNLIPIPPLDGAKVLEALLPSSWVPGYVAWRARMDMNPMLGMIVVVLIVYGLGSIWGNLIYNLAQIIAGI